LTVEASGLKSPQRVLRVGELTRYLRRMVEGDRLLQDISVMGEVGSLSHPGSGHYYFVLKENDNQLPCIMQRREALQQGQQAAALRPGVNIVAEGALTIYEPRGLYQLSVRRIRVQGAGEARQRFERLRRQLEAEGLFAEERKRPLPTHPATLALITSPNSNAYHDVLTRLRAQWPRIKVIVAGSNVQGEQAPAQIALALDIVNRMTRADEILLVRGGGSQEELDCFNDERIARAIFASRIPVITGIGHEQDYTIADYVADVRAPTPTAAAHLAVPDGIALRMTCRKLRQDLRVAIVGKVGDRRRALRTAEAALLRFSPDNRVRVRRQRLDEIWERMWRLNRADMARRRSRLDGLSRQLQLLDPLGVLARGYAVITDPDSGRVISTVGQAAPGRRLKARVRDGSFPLVVEETP